MKTRTETKTRTVQRMIAGRMRTKEESYTEDVPVIPKDRDAQVVAAIVSLAVIIVAGAIVWSTVAIGGLLSVAFPVWISFGIAAVFDAAWIGCLALEWLLRYDAERVSMPRRAGWGALALSMTLIAAHGYEEHALFVGIAGAFVSLVAKGFWHLVMKSTGAELDPESAEEVRYRRADAHAELALIGSARQLNRLKAQAHDELAALSYEKGDPAQAHSADQVIEPVDQLSSAQGRKAQRMAQLSELLSHEPELTPAQVMDKLGVSLATAKRDLKEARS